MGCFFWNIRSHKKRRTVTSTWALFMLSSFRTFSTSRTAAKLNFKFCWSPTDEFIWSERAPSYGFLEGSNKKIKTQFRNYETSAASGPSAANKQSAPMHPVSFEGEPQQTVIYSQRLCEWFAESTGWARESTEHYKPFETHLKRVGTWRFVCAEERFCSWCAHSHKPRVVIYPIWSASGSSHWLPPQAIRQEVTQFASTLVENLDQSLAAQLIGRTGTGQSSECRVNEGRIRSAKLNVVRREEWKMKKSILDYYKQVEMYKC